jgi:hypothetical protein
MAQFTQDLLPGRTAVIVADGALAEVYRADPAYTEVLNEEAVDELKGPEIDARLRELGLPTTGKVDERRARLAEHQPAVPQGVELITTPDPGVLAPNADRDAVGATPTTTRGALDRDAEHNKEN